MIKILLIILLTAITGLQSQSLDIASIGKGRAFKLTGGISANFAYRDSNLPQQGLPFTYIMQGHLNLGFYQFSMPVRYSYSNRQSQFNYQLPFSLNRLSIHPKYKWITAHIGDVSMQLSPYTLNGHQFTGAGLEINHPRGITFGFMGGRLLKAIEDTGEDQQKPSFKRTGYGAKLGYNQKKYSISISGFYAKDDINSLEEVPVEKKVLPQENFTFSLESDIKLVKNMKLKLMYATSALTQDLRADVDEDYTGFSNLFMQNRNSTNHYIAYKVAVNYKIAGNNLSLGFEHIDPGYQTLGAYYFNNDLENVTLNASRSLFNRKLNLSFNIGYQKDNLDFRKFMTTNRMVGAFNFQAQLTERININGSYSNFTTHTNRPLNRLDLLENIDPLSLQQLEFNQLSQNASLNMNWQIAKNKNFNQNLNFNYSLAGTSNEQGGVVAPGQSSNFHNAMASYNIRFGPQKLSITTALNYTYNDMDINTTKGWGGTLSINKRFLDNKLTTGLAASYNHNNNHQINTGIMNIRMRASYSINQHQFGINLLNMYKKTDMLDGLNQFRMSFNYAYSFDAFKKKKEEEKSVQKERKEKSSKTKKTEKSRKTAKTKKENTLSDQQIFKTVNSAIDKLYKDALASKNTNIDGFKIYEARLDLSRLNEEQKAAYLKRKKLFERHQWLLDNLKLMVIEKTDNPLVNDFKNQYKTLIIDLYNQKIPQEEMNKKMELELLKYLNKEFDKLAQ